MSTAQKTTKNGATRANILLVDDDPEVRNSLGRALESENYRVTTASDGPEAIEDGNHGQVDLVVLDLNLPGMSGWDVFERLTERNPILPIVIITARTDQYELAAAAGVAAIMEKPLSLPTLIETIDRLTNEPTEARLRRMAAHQPILLAAASS